MLKMLPKSLWLFCPMMLVTPDNRPLTTHPHHASFSPSPGSGSIRRIDRHGESSLFVKSSLLACPNGITMDDEKNLYVSNFYNGDVVRISRDGEASRLATLPGANNGHLVYTGGKLYVVARGAHRISNR